MEEANKNEIKDLLGNITDYKSELTSGNEELENPDGKSVEKYFNLKLRTQLDVKHIYSNIRITPSDFLKELELYLCFKTFNEENLDKKVAKNIIDQFTQYLKGETDIEIDSFLPYVSGQKIQKFFGLIKNYSFPTIVEGIKSEKKYTVLVESTYCLIKNIIKKTEQMRKNFLFFSVLNKLYKQNENYLKDFYEFFVRKHIFSDKRVKTFYDFEKDKEFNLSSFENLVILFISNSKYNYFKEVQEKIKKESNLSDNEKEFSIEKCFTFPINLTKKVPNISQKKFQEKEEHNDSDLSKSNDEKKKQTDRKIFDSYRILKYLLQKINDEKNVKVKVIYLDLYLNVLTPKTEIMNRLEGLYNKITITESKLVKTEESLEETKKIVDNLVKYIKDKDPDFKLEGMK